MEFLHHTISWPTFFWTCLVVGLVWLFTTKTVIGANIIASETRWSRQQWVRVLLVIVISMFILINPLFHLLAVAVVGGLYYLLVSEKFIGKNILSLKENGTVTTGNLIAKSRSTLLLVCKPREVSTDINVKTILERCLFSFPYIKVESLPIIHFLDDSYELELSLTNAKYLSSLLDYLRQSGIEAEIKINK